VSDLAITRPWKQPIGVKVLSASDHRVCTNNSSLGQTKSSCFKCNISFSGVVSLSEKNPVILVFIARVVSRIIHHQ
jgi:hypothetical protein